jgi:hypothetical protein
MADHIEFAEAFAKLLNGTLKMKCAICGEESCGCWEKCSCGWSTLAGEPCRNPATTRCSTKVKYGRYNRKTKRYEKRTDPR